MARANDYTVILNTKLDISQIQKDLAALQKQLESKKIDLSGLNNSVVINQTANAIANVVDNSEKVNHHTVERNVLADEYSNEEIDNMISGISFEDATTVNGHTVDRNVLADEYTNQQINMLLKSTTKTITIQPSEFVEGVYTLNDDLITETSNQEILPAAYSEENKAMIDAFNAAAFQDVENGQTTGQTKFICTGEVPTIPINIRIIFRGDK